MLWISQLTWWNVGSPLEGEGVSSSDNFGETMVTVKDLGVGGWSSHRLFQTGLGGPGQGCTVSSYALSRSRIRFRYLTKEAGPMRVLGRANQGL